MVCGSEVHRWCVGVRLPYDGSGKCRNLFKIIIIKTNQQKHQSKHLVQRCRKRLEGAGSGMTAESAFFA